MSDSTSHVDEKAAALEHRENADVMRARKPTKADKIKAIDAIATAPGVTRASFAHIDEKKLLRKMDWRLLPMLTLLYLLSFIDRGNIVRTACPCLKSGAADRGGTGKCKD